MTINQAVGQPDPTNTSPINFTVIFSEPVTGFATGDVTVGGTSGGAKTGTVTRRPDHLHRRGHRDDHLGHGGRDHRAPGVATDLAGNTNAASTSADNTVTWDVVAPDRHDQPGGGPARPDQRASPINFTVVFSETVIGFATGDVTLGGTAGGTLDRHRHAAAGPTYNVAVTGMTTPGTVIATLGAGVATDPAGNANVASTSTDNTVTWDNVAPTVTIDQAARPGRTRRTDQPDRSSRVVQRAGDRLRHRRRDVRRNGGRRPAGSAHGRPDDLQRGRDRHDHLGHGDRRHPAAAVTDLAGNANVASTSTDNT